MKKLNQYLITIFLIISLMNTAYGFAGMAINKSTAPQDLANMTNTTQSDQDIQLIQHLIELDAVQFESQNKLEVRETLIFKNTGDRNFSGTLRTWVPDGVSDINAERRNMMDGSLEYGLPLIQNGNIISWQDKIGTKSLPPLYALEYVLAAEPQGSLTKSLLYSKKLAYPTLINYKYGGNPGLPAVVLKIRKPQGSSIVLLDENRNTISTQDVSEIEGATLYKFTSPQFKELNIEISKPAAAPAGIAGYVILGFLIILVLAYPVLRKKSEKLQAFEEKIITSLRKHEDTEKEPEKEFEKTAPEIEPEEAGADDAEFGAKTKDELEKEKSDALSKLDKLDKDYASGNLLDEEYEELRNSYEGKIKKINERIENT